MTWRAPLHHLVDDMASEVTLHSQMTPCAVLLGWSNGEGAWRGTVTIVELIDPRPYIFSLPDLGG